MKKKILFVLFLLASLFLFACSNQERKVEYEGPPIKKYMKTFDKDGTLLTDLSGYDISLDYRTEYSDHPIAYRKNKSIKRHLAHMSLLDDNCFYPFMWGYMLGSLNGDDDRRHSYKRIILLSTIDGTTTEIDNQSTIFYNEKVIPDYDSLNDPSFSTRSINDLKKYIKKKNAVYFTAKDGKILYVFSGDNIKIESISQYYDINVYKLYADDYVVTFYDFDYKIVNINNLN